MSKRRIIVFFLFVLVLIALAYSKLSPQENDLIVPMPVVTQEPTTEPENLLVIDSTGPDKPLTLTATLKKEPIPAELELGDYWYWLYFDKPHLLVNNAKGLPMEIDKMQVAPPDDPAIILSDFVDKKVEVYGYQTWGYAESSVFKILSLKKVD